VDSSDFQNILDLDYPVDEGSITTHDSWNGWGYDRALRQSKKIRADKGETYKCDAYYPDDLVDIMGHALDGKAFHT
jgi:hypothetical protein